MKNLLLAIALVSTCPALAQARPGQTMKLGSIRAVPGVARQFRANTVIFDLDDTLVRPRHQIGSGQWFSVLRRTMQQRIPDKDAALEATRKTWNAVHQKARIKTVERCTSKTVRGLSQSHRVLALTARDGKLVGPTLKALRKAGLPFGGGPRIDLGRGACYQGGVIFAGSPENKLHALKVFERRVGSAGRIVVVDNRESNVTSLVDGLGSRIKGVHYTGADAARARFDPKLAARQLEIFERTGRILSDASVRSGNALRRHAGPLRASQVGSADPGDGKR